MKNLSKWDRNGVRTPVDVERRYKLGMIEPTAEDVEQLKKDWVVDDYLSTTSTNAVQNAVITKNLNNKVTKETGKGLSTNDFTNTYKNASHTHSNKDVLDTITEEDIENWNNNTGGGGTSIKLIDKDGTPSDTNTYHANAINELVKDVYSTEEQVIGTWKDGKTLYRKVIEISITSTGGYPTYNLSDYGITNFDTIYFANGTYDLRDNRYSGEPGRYFSAYIDKTNKTIVFIEPSNTGTRVNVLEYTKTTD